MEAKIKFIPGQVPQWTFDDRIRKVRRGLGLTQEEFAVKLGVGDKRYAAWESGRNTPDDMLSIAKTLEDVSGIDKLWFIGWMDESPESPTTDTQKAPTREGEGQQLPDLDSNQEPIGSQLAPVTRLPQRATTTTERNTLATITKIGA